MTNQMIRLVKTCAACPEQSDAFRGDRKIGYLRLRYGHFRVDYRSTPNDEWTTIFRASPDGDGSFKPKERHRFLNDACRALLYADNHVNDSEEPALYTVTDNLSGDGDNDT